MKSLSIFIGGFITAVALIAGGGYVAMQYYSSIAEEYQSEWTPDFDEQLFESTARLAAAKTEYERWVASGNVGLWNVDNGSLEIAESFANKTLEIAEKYKEDWNYGNAIHKGHLTLGRVALRKGNIEEAKIQLLLAAKTPGSPQLDSFGPNMVLAKELLEKGETETVLQYLELCEVFWDMDMGKLMIWEEKISKNEKPNYGANLLY